MPVVLPLISYLLLVRVMAYRAGLRSAAIFAAIWWGCVLDALTEGLGAFHLLTRIGTSVAWLLTALAVLAWDVTRRNGPPRGATRPPPAPAVSLSPGDRALLGATGVLVALVGLTAVVCPPNTWDVIDYHLPRVAMWMSNRSVSFFPTLDYAQLINSPWSEYAMLHLDLLMGNDRLVNLVEFASLIASITVASLIARELGAEGAGQVFAAVACATIPAAVLEASGAMNTLVASFWIAAAVYCVMVFGRDANWGTYLAAAVACGLAILTKGTAYVLLPALIAAGWWLGERTARRRFIVGLPVFILIVASLNAPLWYRNVQLTGSPLGSGEGLLEGGQGTALATGRLSLRGTVTNVVRNLALHSTITGGVDDYAGRLASRLIVALGDDPNDRDLIWQTPPEVPGESFHTNPPSRHEIFVGYPLHLLLIAIACVLTLVAARRGVSNCLIFALGLLGSFLLFCALLRWQIWGARYQLPLFVLGSALAGSLLPAYARRRTTDVIGWLLLIAALPYAFSNDLRPLLFAHLSPSRWMQEPYGGSIWGKTRGALYYADQHQDLADSYSAATSAVLRSGCRDVALDDSLEHYEYPVMAQLDVSTGHTRVRYAGVYNSSLRYAAPDQAAPCAVICFACARVPHKWSEYRAIGGRVGVFGNVAVFGRDGEVPNAASTAVSDSAHNLPDLIAGMRRDILDLRDFRAHGEGGREAAYRRGIDTPPKAGTTLEQLYRAVERPLYDGSRVWELTAGLRERVARNPDSPGPASLAIEPLLAGSEALSDFAGTAPRAADALARFVAREGRAESPGEP